MMGSGLSQRSGLFFLKNRQKAKGEKAKRQKRWHKHRFFSFLFFDSTSLHFTSLHFTSVFSRFFFLIVVSSSLVVSHISRLSKSYDEDVEGAFVGVEVTTGAFWTPVMVFAIASARKRMVSNRIL